MGGDLRQNVLVYIVQLTTLWQLKITALSPDIEKTYVALTKQKDNMYTKNTNTQQITETQKNTNTERYAKNSWI